MEQNKNLFIHTAMQHMGALKNWPDASVPVTSLVTEYIPEICQVPYDYLFCKDPVAMCECTLLVWEYLGLDILTGNMDCYNIEGEAMGAHMRYYTDHCPDFDRSDPFIKTKADIEKIRFGGLDTGRFRYLIRYHQAYKQYTGLDSFPVFSAPWTLAGNLYGIEKLVMDTINDPEFVCELQRRIVEDYHVPMFRALAGEIPGFRLMDFSDAFACIPIVNVDIIEEFVRPYLELELEKIGIPGIGLADRGLFGSGMLQGEDRESFVDFVVWSNGKVLCNNPDAALMGPQTGRDLATARNVPVQIGISASDLQDRSVDEIRALVKEYVLTAKRGPTPGIFFLNNIGPQTKEINIRTAIQTARIYGAPEADENTPYIEPETFPFTDFIRNKMTDNREGYTFEWLNYSKMKEAVKC